MSQEIVPYDIFDVVDRPMKFIMYGDSVAEYTITTIRINNMILFIPFKKLWKLLNKNYKIEYGYNKEYMRIPDVDIFGYNEIKQQMEFMKCEKLIRHYITDQLCRIKTKDTQLDLTNQHSLLNMNDSKLIEIKPETAETVLTIQKDNNLLKTEIIEKEQINYSGYIYDFKNVENNNFTANNILVHNTDSMYINVPTLKPKTTEEAIEKAEELSNEINSIIIDFHKKFLMPKLGIAEDQCYTNFDTEIVCDRFLLLDVKKRYAYRMIADKGKTLKKPKIKYTGIPVVRTDYAVLTKTFIKRIVEETTINQIDKHLIMAKLNEIAKDIMDEVKSSIEEFEFGPIARPCKWSTNYKGDDPYQVIAMRLYNTIVDDNVFTPISSAQYVPIKITNPGNFDLLISPFKNKHENFLNSIPMTKLNNLALPYGYDKNKVKTLMNKLSIVVDVNDVWSIIYNKDCQRIINAIKQSLG